MSIGIDPLVDFACKKLLGSPEHPAITLHFLNAVLDGAPKITEVEILNPIIEKEFDEDKYSILDVRAKDQLGHRFNIEIQRTKPTALRERLTYYVATQLVEQIGTGSDYADLRPSIGICILDAILFRDIPDLHLDFRLMNAKHRLTLTDHLQIHLLELPKYSPPSHNEAVTHPIEQWCYFFQQADELTAEEIIRRLPDPAFSEATGVLEMISRDPDQRRLYEERLKFERDVRANLDFARQEARQEGLQEGRQEGLEVGKREERIRTIKMLREIAGIASPSNENLSNLSLDELALIEQDIQQRLRKRGLQ
ncbi:Rpn family recombination-promoting nuclease/putative transposase [Novipirellula sp. SH528]|uniref:Rpn family recombination-promoting nuclease/putative transposase n=1 Tax=Novipirellula sp. SH528 TaxID=3454466 RepID=UPI003F9EC752